MISSWVTDAAPWRVAVPRQSAPVSPPPMITTCLPVGGDLVRRPRSPSATRLACGRYSIAWWMPPSSRPGTGRSRATVAPDREHDGVVPLAQLLAGEVAADVDAGAEDRALAAHLVEPPVEVRLLHLELGDAVAQQPADLVGPLVDGDGVAGPGQLLGGGQPGRAGADHGDGLAREPLGRLRPDVAGRPRPGR